ncbi:MAG: hypothetical protein PHG04_03410 [Candidatus Nanoarchaeia archaeon]|nr:hypothetical protein [Candidatus Nanoarchaeia archaeon]
MIGVIACTLFAYYGMKYFPKLEKAFKEKKKNNALEKILSSEGGVCENNHVNGLSNVYLSKNEFEKYFGNKKSADAYIKTNGKTRHAKFVNFESENCPVLEYLHEMSDIFVSQANNSQLNPLWANCFLLDNIMLGAKGISGADNNSFTPELIHGKIGELMDYYIKSGIVEKIKIDSGQSAKEIYLLSPLSADFRINKRYAVESGGLTWLGRLDNNYSSADESEFSVLGLNQDRSIEISSDKEFNEKVLAPVLTNAENAILQSGGLLAKAGDEKWENVLKNFAGEKIMLTSEQYVNFVRLEDIYLSETENGLNNGFLQKVKSAIA